MIVCELAGGLRKRYAIQRNGMMRLAYLFLRLLLFSFFSIKADSPASLHCLKLYLWQKLK
jgi:hypothetical protein